MGKQEIQDAREFITEDEYNCGAEYGNEPIETVLGRYSDIILQALDIAEKQVWLPISELPRKINGDVFLMYATHDAGGYCFVGTINLVGDITSMMRGGKEAPTHYMPLPTPPQV